MRKNAGSAKRRNLTITDADYARLREVGKGNASEGLRTLASAPQLDSMGLMVVAAFRYSLTRNTYMSSACASWLAAEWDRLPERDRIIVEREVSEALERGYIAECDRAEWLALIDQTNGTRQPA
ncbi:MAG: hypothetical protein Tp138OMZ00d2C19078221_62 [Prokaryotic dsDNA virus sp.]|jgi:hypothetical protein|nr:hypothetical protein [Pseudomonadales bacterium]QDP67490.1 MAG: hypothetical protein Tp138OMZ00d2C19078221_62 [Prokaryotic dsDNA virus sp.]|tara:strand:- start:27466 stop:27837 length:372 start_codon:yes stop_codon:yes gene_type:complete